MSVKKSQRKSQESCAEHEPKTFYLAGELHQTFHVKVKDEFGRVGSTKVKLPTGCVGVMFAFRDSFRAKCYSPGNKPITIQVNGK